MGTNITGPVLNISAYYIGSPDVFGEFWVDNTTGSTPFSNYSLSSYANNNDTYNVTYIQQKGICQQTPTYKWGFAFVILYILTVLLLAWVIGMYLTWLKAHFAMDSLGHPVVPDEYKAIMELAAAIQKEFIESGQDPNELTGHQIEKHIKTELRGGAICLQDALKPGNTAFFPTWYQWAKSVWWTGTRKWWISSLIVSVVAAMSIFFSAGYSPGLGFGIVVLCFIPVGILCALLIGSKLGSRLLIISFFTTLGIVFGVIASTV